MRRLKKVMLLTAVVGSIGLTGAGTAHADEKPDTTVENAQLLKCDQEFRSLVFVAPTISLFGDSVANIGNICRQQAPPSR